MQLGKRIKKAAKKVGRAMGGPVTAAVDAGRAAKEGKGVKGAAKAFGKAATPGASVKELHEAHTETLAGVTEEVLGEAAAGRVEDLGRVLKPAIPDAQGPLRTLETMGSAAKAVGEGEYRRAGRSMGRIVTQNAADMLAPAVATGQATGDFFDSPTERLDEDLLPVLRRVFGEGLDYDRIRIKQGRPGPGRGTQATAFLDMIYLGDRTQLDAGGATVTLLPEGVTVPLPDSVLVHELVHAWQRQHGGNNYLAEAVFGYGAHGEQASYRWWNFTDRHNDKRVDGRPNKRSHGNNWRDLPVEAQAEFIQNAFEARAFLGDRRATSYLTLRLGSNDFVGAASTSYEAAFGPSARLDWTLFLRQAVRALHRGDFRH